MRLRKYQIRITAEAVDARWDDSDRSIWLRLWFGAAVALWGAVLAYIGLIKPDRNGYSVWWRLVHDHLTSRFLTNVVIPDGMAFVVWSFFAAMGIRSFFASGQMLHCDRSQLKISKIPWLNFAGQWRSRTFPVAAISEADLAIWPTRTRETSYLICFRVNEKRQKILAGITAIEAHRILKGLKALGVDIRRDPDRSLSVRESIRDRRAEL